jgi:ABC-type lipoprotein export system ATPase subunit
VIRLEGVSKRYAGLELAVLDGVDLTVERHEFVSVVGRSGSGKTTLLNIIGGLDSRFQGLVQVGGVKLDDLDDSGLAAFRNQRVGHVFQAYHLLDHLSCRENVALAALFARGGGRRDAAAVRARADDALTSVGLEGAGSRRPATLSGGERQRVALARALFSRPEILLCDEPTGNLDTETAGMVIDLLVSLHRDQQMTIVTATHDETICAAGGRVLSLTNGQLRRPNGGRG